MDHLKDNFADGGPVSQVPASWYNRVARFINNLVPSDTIRFEKHDDGNATVLEAVSKKPDDLTHNDITDWDAATADFLDGDDYDAIIEAIGDVADIVDGILADYLDSGDIDVTVAAKNHTHTTANITDWDAATADFLTDADMSNYALEDDLLTLAEEVTGIEDDLLELADAVDLIDTDLAALEDDFDDLYAALYPSGTKGWVDLTTNQTINGVKSFTSSVFIRTAATQYFEIENATNSTRGYFGLGEIWLDKNTGAIPIHFRGFDKVEKARIYYDYADNALKLLAYKPDGSWGPQNKVCLGIAPTDTSSTSELGIATLGWVNSKFVRKPSGKTPFTGTKKEITNISWDGTYLKYSSVNRDYENGILCGETQNNDTVIDTPVVYSPV